MHGHHMVLSVVVPHGAARWGDQCPAGDSGTHQCQLVRVRQGELQIGHAQDAGLSQGGVAAWLAKDDDVLMG
jgi:hypothetical protein